MKRKYSFYFQKNNSLFDGPVISACYKADEDENFTNHNLRFANIESAISEEKCIYNLLKKGE